jgi:sulfatase maturation enzyme AslB (radical SAM superfamily)
MDIAVAETAIDAFARLMKGQESSRITISFYGGEPLLNWRMVRKALRCGNVIFGDRVYWVLNTNATLLTPEIATVLKQENVDIHISIDGPDEGTNRYRRFKNGKPVLKKVMESLEILKEQGCSIQFDSCLTDVNIYSLKRLIDLAAESGADRIYLALIDRLETQDLLDVELVASKVIEAMKYGEHKGVSLGGPWKRAIYGSSNMSNRGNEVPHLIINPSAEVSFPAYNGKGLGHINLVGSGRNDHPLPTERLVPAR